MHGFGTAQATLACLHVSQQDALDLLNRWGGQPLPLNASAWVRDTTVEPVQDYLFVRLRGAVAAVEAAVAAGTNPAPDDPIGWPLCGFTICPVLVLKAAGVPDGVCPGS